jgi:hypothetical protein
MKSLNSSDLLSDKEARNELYDLLHQSLSRKQAIERVVEIGTGYLDLDHGHIASINEAENRWEVIGSTDSPEGPYPDGLTSELSDSILPSYVSTNSTTRVTRRWQSGLE